MEIASSVEFYLPDFLVPSPEKGLHWTEQQVHAWLTADPKGYIAYLNQAFEAMASDLLYAEFPPKQILTDRYGNGDFRTMPCVTEHNGTICKTVKIVGTNLDQQKVPGQITVGRAYVLDSRENFITHAVDACLLSSARTGACAILAVNKLADSAKLSIIGCGRVGYYTLLFALATIPGCQISLADAAPAKAIQLMEYFTSIVPNATINTVSVEEALSIPVVILATTSGTPIASPENTTADFIVSLGADADDQSELSISWADLDNLEIMVDTHDCQRFGDLKKWNTAGKLDGHQLRDLVSIYRHQAKRSCRGLFVSTGSALFDNLTLRYLLKLDRHKEGICH